MLRLVSSKPLNAGLPPNHSPRGFFVIRCTFDLQKSCRPLFHVLCRASSESTSGTFLLVVPDLSHFTIRSSSANVDDQRVFRVLTGPWARCARNANHPRTSCVCPKDLRRQSLAGEGLMRVECLSLNLRRTSMPPLWLEIISVGITRRVVKGGGIPAEDETS